MLAGAPVTNLHPAEGKVTAENWRKRAVGHTSETVRRDGDKIVGDIYVQDSYTIDLIEKNERREVSCGYLCRLDMTPGVTPSGERYDAIQRDIRYNHVALVPKGRAGSEVSLRLDSEGNQCAESAEVETTMDRVFEVISGTRYEVGTEAHAKAAQDRDAKLRQDAERLDSVSKLEGRVAALEAENAKLRQDAAELPKRIAEGVKARIALMRQAAKAGVEVREDASDDDIRRAVIGKVLPGVSLEGKDGPFVEGVYQSALAALGKRSSAGAVRQDAIDAVRGSEREEREDAADDLPPDVKARQAMIRRGRERAIRPELDKG